METITPASLLRCIGSEDAGCIIDVRSPAEYKSGHIPGAKNIPLNQIAGNLPEMLSGRTKAIIVCKSGTRARMACERLMALGFSGATCLLGGTDAWKNEGGVIEGGGSEVMSIERQVRIGAGAFVLLGTALGYYVNPGFFLLSAFVGAGLIFAGLTDWCGMGILLMRMPWNNRNN